MMVVRLWMFGCSPHANSVTQIGLLYVWAIWTMNLPAGRAHALQTRLLQPVQMGQTCCMVD